MKAYFVTGTDTEVGKTTVSTAILAAASASGLRTAAMKPLESGCTRAADGTLQPADALQLQSAASLEQSLESICLYRFEAAVAPGVAAESGGVSIDLGRIEEAFARLRGERPDLALVEGAGGALVPIGGGRMILEIATLLQIPAIIVARPGLGTINHTLLTVEALARRGIEIAGVIMNCRDDATPESLHRSNIDEITRTGVRYLGTLPVVATHSLEALGQAARDSLDLDALISG